MILIDGWNLRKADVVRCNELREVLGPMWEHLFDTEYTKQLIRGYNERRLQAHRVHLVWQVRDISEPNYP